MMRCTDTTEMAPPPPSGSPPDSTERLDKWLWAARFFKTRSLAAQAVAGGKVEVNGARAKPARRLRTGERLTIQRGASRWEVVVRGLNRERRPAREAILLYEESAESREARSSEEARHRQAEARRARGLGRPTKRERRELDRLHREA